MPPHGRPGRADRRSAPTRPGTCPSRRSASCSADEREIAGYTIGNDVSSRDIEGANPLYLPAGQGLRRRVRDRPGRLRARRLTSRRSRSTLRITDEWRRRCVFAGETSTARMKRSFAELVALARPRQPRPAGSVLLTGTGLVPPDDFTPRVPATWSRSTSRRSARSSNPVVRASELIGKEPVR